MTLVLLALVGVVGLAGLAWVAATPQRSAFVMAGMVVTDFSGIAESEFGVQGPILPVAAAVYMGAGVRFLWSRTRFDDLRVVPFVAVAALAVSAVLVSAALGGFVAEDPSNSYDAFVELVKNLFIAGAVGVVAIDAKGFRGALFGLVTGAGLLAAITTLQGLTGTQDVDWFGFAGWSQERIAGAGDTVRAAGPFGEDPNAYAQHLVGVVGVAGAIAASRLRSMPQRALAAAAAVAMIVAVLFTASRGGLLALGAVAAVLVATTRSPARLGALAVGAALVFALVGPVDVGSRLETLSDLTAIGDEDSTLTERSLRGRASEMLAAVQMFADHPVAGVGYGGYNDRYLEYSRDIGLDPRFEDRSAHSLPLEIAAEQGLIGIAAWGSFFGVAIAGAWRLRRRVRWDGTALLAAYAGFGATAIFLHDVHPRFMFVLVALGIAAGVRAALHPPSRPPGDDLRVAMVIQNYLPSVGGAERQLASLVPLLQGRGVTPIVITRGREGRPEHDTIAGGQVIRVPVSGPKIVQSLQFVDRAARTIRELEVDAVIAFDSLTPSTIGRGLWRTDDLFYATKILRSGELGDLQRLERKRFGRRRLRNLLQSAHTFITISDDIARELMVRGVRAERRRYIPNGVDTKRFCHSVKTRRRVRRELELGDAPVAIMTGRIAPEKRVVEIARRWHEVREHQPDAVLLVAGDGPLLSELDGIDGVRPLGRREDVPDLLAASDLYLSASVAEGLSNSLLEAMATRLGCVVTDVGGVADVITDGVDGVVVSPDDLDALLASVTALAVDDERRSDMAVAARNRIMSRFTLDSTADALAELCADLAAARNPAMAADPDEALATTSSGVR